MIAGDGWRSFLACSTERLRSPADRRREADRLEPTAIARPHREVLAVVR
jgi:hypothetical protein